MKGFDGDKVIAFLKLVNNTIAEYKSTTTLKKV